MNLFDNISLFLKQIMSKCKGRFSLGAPHVPPQMLIDDVFYPIWGIKFVFE